MNGRRRSGAWFQERSLSARPYRCVRGDLSGRFLRHEESRAVKAPRRQLARGVVVNLWRRGVFPLGDPYECVGSSYADTGLGVGKQLIQQWPGFSGNRLNFGHCIRRDALDR